MIQNDVAYDFDHAMAMINGVKNSVDTYLSKKMKK